MKDFVLLGALVVGLAVAVTFHVTLLFGVARRSPQRGLLALFVPPLAPYWGATLGMRFRTVGWILSVTGYAVARVLTLL